MGTQRASSSATRALQRRGLKRRGRGGLESRLVKGREEEEEEEKEVREMVRSIRRACKMPGRGVEVGVEGGKVGEGEGEGVAGAKEEEGEEGKWVARLIMWRK
jgi:hypothetical protein